MKSKRARFIFLLAIFASACESSSVKEDLEAYCDCIHQMDVSNCEKMKEDIIERYEYDPEASSYIADRLSDCMK